MLRSKNVKRLYLASNAEKFSMNKFYNYGDQWIYSKVSENRQRGIFRRA